MRNHMVCLRGDLLSIGLDFADRFPEATRKIMNGEPLAVIEYDPRPNTADAPLPQS
ncbi:hypothetical protein ACFWIA_28055 [Streptomyces sp. NPDC127068]|uniref:hypothetical protein n=1 Tax=Streptomyces sp. NPDC127068 TaxID=3347127 RepID=UPI003656371F